MSIIQKSSVGIPVGLTRGEKVLRYAFLALMLGAIAYSTGGTFVGRDNRLIDYSVADSALLLASLAPGSSRPIPGAHRALRACEWVVMGCSLVCTAAVIVGDVTDHGVRPDPYNMPWNVAIGAALVAFCFYTILLVSKERARRRGLVPPAR
ncbi:hypothetical protein [Actinomyces sp.]